MKTVTEYIEQLHKVINLNQENLNKVTKLLELYPDLGIAVGRWEKQVFCSPAVNSSVTDCDIRHNCGCCSDSPLEIWPYKETEYGKVYSNPAIFRVGERGYYCDMPYENWETWLKEEGISDVVIDIVKKYFADEKKKAREEFDSTLDD